jgi:hypothetical protein
MSTILNPDEIFYRDRQRQVHLRIQARRHVSFLNYDEVQYI